MHFNHASFAQNPDFFNVGHGKVGFSDDQIDRLRRAFDKINSSYCADWVNRALQSLRGREDLPGTGTRPTTVQGLEMMATLNHYDPANSASQMGITQGEKSSMDKKGADGVTFGSPDSMGRPFTRIFLRRVTNLVNNAYTRFEYSTNQTRVDSYATIQEGLGEAHSFKLSDGHGRVIASASDHPGSTGGLSGQLIFYDKLGRIIRQSNPTETSASSTSGNPYEWVATGDDAYNAQTEQGDWRYTDQTFDWKSRPLVTTNPDGTTKSASYSGCGCAGGEVATLTDEGTIDGGVARRRQQKIYRDIIGRTVKTELLNWEGGTVYSATVNAYNARDQVTKTRQYAGDENSGTYQDTDLTYDGYGRLWKKHAPEQNSGTFTEWEYNLDDAVHKLTDARGASATYSYNPRQLLSGITYSAPEGVPTTPNVSFTYDAAGNRTSMTDAVGGMTYNYDQLSRLTSETRTFTGLAGSYVLGYSYNLAGALTSLAEPSQFGATVNYAYDSVGQLVSVTGSNMQVSALMTGLQYRASGALKHAAYADGTQLNMSYNERQLLSRYELNNVTDSTSYPNSVTTMGSENQYYADGRIHYAQDLRNGDFDRGYTYDRAGRLQEATSGREARGLAPSNPADSPYKQTFSYDVWNNMGRSARHWTSGQVDLPTYTNNRRADWFYDAAGHALVSSQAKTHVFDASGKQVSFYEEMSSGPVDNWVFQENTVVQVYEGDGRPGKRVETRHTEDINGATTNNVKTAYYVRSSVLGGASILEIDSQGQRKGHVYVGSEKLADYEGWAPYGSMTIRHSNSVTGNWVGVHMPGGFGTRTEVDPLGGDVGVTDPYPSGLSYTDITGNNFLYNELGNPFDIGGGCDRLDGMPIPCTELLNEINMGNVALEETTRSGKRYQYHMTGVGLSIIKIG
jgi:YD repeat-containing protein